MLGPARSRSCGSSAKTDGVYPSRLVVPRLRGRFRALSHGKTRDRIHHAEHFLTFIAEIFGQRQRHRCRPPAHQSGFIRRRHDNDGAGQALWAQIVLDELFTSRPRSPIRPMTATSEAVNFASMESARTCPRRSRQRCPYAGRGKWSGMCSANGYRCRSGRRHDPWETLAVVSRATGRILCPVRSGGPPSRGSPMALITRPPAGIGPYHRLISADDGLAAHPNAVQGAERHGQGIVAAEATTLPRFPYRSAPRPILAPTLSRQEMLAISTIRP